MREAAAQPCGQITAHDPQGRAVTNVGKAHLFVPPQTEHASLTCGNKTHTEHASLTCGNKTHTEHACCYFAAAPDASTIEKAVVAGVGVAGIAVVFLGVAERSPRAV